MGIELATNAQRDTFAEEPMEVIKTCCQKIADYSDSLIKDSFDSLILQPASLDVATTKKRPGDDDFGINLGAINPGIHIISGMNWVYIKILLIEWLSKSHLTKQNPLSLNTITAKLFISWQFQKVINFAKHKLFINFWIYGLSFDRVYTRNIFFGILSPYSLVQHYSVHIFKPFWCKLIFFEQLEVRFGSLAYQCGRIHVGDEIVQINYQTVVGWTSKNVIQLLNQEQPTPTLILTLKKRPKHSMSGQMFTIQNFRIPARNEATNVFNNLPSPRAELLVAPDVKFPIQKYVLYYV